VFSVTQDLNFFTLMKGSSVCDRAMAETVSRRTVTAKTRVRPQTSPYDICRAQIGTWAGFLRVLRVSPVSITPLTHHIHLHTDTDTALIRKTNVGRLGNLHACGVSDIGEVWTEKQCQLYMADKVKTIQSSGHYHVCSNKATKYGGGRHV